MPGRLSKPQEKYWRESKKIVRDETGKPQDKFKDINWGLVQKIFQAKKKKHLGKGKKKKKSDLIAELVSFAEFLDERGHFEVADAVDAILEKEATAGEFNETELE